MIEEIKIDNNGLVDITNLKYHPLNEMLYPLKEHQSDIVLLAEKLQQEYDKTGVPNHTPIVICKETDYIFSGNFRVRAAKVNNQKYQRMDIQNSMKNFFSIKKKKIVIS